MRTLPLLKCSQSSHTWRRGADVSPGSHGSRGTRAPGTLRDYGGSRAAARSCQSCPSVTGHGVTGPGPWGRGGKGPVVAGTPEGRGAQRARAARAARCECAALTWKSSVRPPLPPDELPGLHGSGPLSPSALPGEDRSRPQHTARRRRGFRGLPGGAGPPLGGPEEASLQNIVCQLFVPDINSANGVSNNGYFFYIYVFPLYETSWRSLSVCTVPPGKSPGCHRVPRCEPPPPPKLLSLTFRLLRLP